MDVRGIGSHVAVLAGRSSMLLPFVPFVNLPLDLTRFVGVVGGAALAIWTLRRLDLPPCRVEMLARVSAR